MTSSIISIIVPIFNAERFLSQCVDSVLGQTYKHIEILLLNDGSTDSSGAICQKYAEQDSRVVYIEKKNTGVSDTRNEGLKLAKGKYVFFLDSDDYLDPQCLEMLYSVVDDGNLPITGYWLDFTEKSLVYVPEQAYGNYPSLKDYLIDFHKFFATKFNFVWGKLYRLDVIREHGITFNKDIHLGEDQLFDQEYYRHCHKGIIAIRHNGYYYRQCGTASLSKKFDARMFEWNEYCFASLRNYLKEYECFTKENAMRFYEIVFGDYQYSFHLIALNTSMTLEEKTAIIRRYLPTPIYKDSQCSVKSRRFDYRFFNWLLQHNLVRLYIIFEIIKKNLLYVNHT